MPAGQERPERKGKENEEQGRAQRAGAELTYECREEKRSRHSKQRMVQAGEEKG